MAFLLYNVKRNDNDVRMFGIESKCCIRIMIICVSFLHRYNIFVLFVCFKFRYSCKENCVHVNFLYGLFTQIYDNEIAS